MSVETELWPAIFFELQKSGIPTMIVNGRMSAGSFQRYSMIRAFIGTLIGNLSAIAAISEVDSHRFRELGARQDTLMVTGNIKYDFPVQNIDSVRKTYRKLLQVGDEKIFICGSTRTGEEEKLYPAFRELVRKSDAKIIWVIAPRHLERLEKVSQMLTGYALKFDWFSSPEVVVHSEQGENIFSHCG